MVEYVFKLYVENLRWQTHKQNKKSSVSTEMFEKMIELFCDRDG